MITVDLPTMDTHPELTTFAAGKPAPQGSKNAIPIYTGRGPTKTFTGNVSQVESSAKALKPWRIAVRNACQTLDHQPKATFPEGMALFVALVFVMPRPVGMSKKQPTPPHTKRPDQDKLTRAVYDAITWAEVWHDDAQVVEGWQYKRYAEPGEQPGCWISIRERTTT